MNARSLTREQFLGVAQMVVSRGGLIRCRVHGQSMRPAIADDDEVVLGPVSPAHLAIGDVVLARTDRGPKLHRVIARGIDARGPFVTLRGDTQLGPGQRVRHAEVLALVISVERSLAKAASAWGEHFARRLAWLWPRPSDAVTSSG